MCVGKHQYPASPHTRLADLKCPGSIPQMPRLFLFSIFLTSLVVDGFRTDQCANAMQVSPQERAFRAWDRNHDGMLERNEVPPGPRKIFDRVDRNKDGKISLAEHVAATSSKPARPTVSTSGEFNRHTIRQNWKQQQNGFDREFFVHVPATSPTQRPNGPTSKTWPITFVFHGNGGSARPTIGQWPELLKGHLIVSPQGYQRSWNISDEKSKAPDVEFFQLVVEDIEHRYPNADLSKISLIGFSNGAGFIFRLLIELDGKIQITNAVPLVSSMIDKQYHNQIFWTRSDDSNTNYDVKTKPSGKRHLLTIHGTADRVVPYQGGMRGPNAKHLSAQETAYAWAQQQGFTGNRIPDNAGKPLNKDIIRYNYAEAQVTHLKVLDGGHGFGPVSRQVNELVRDFIQSNLR